MEALLSQKRVQKQLVRVQLIVVCVRTHSDTREILGTAESLQSKQIIELSTGSAPEAESLYDWSVEKGADGLIGMICTFPQGVGEDDSTIVTV